MDIETLKNSEKVEVSKKHNMKPTFLFSVDYILNEAGESNAEIDVDKQNTRHYDWLFCTRFKPPKLDSK